MEKRINYYDSYVGKICPHFFTGIKRSRVNTKVYYQIEYVQLEPLGEENSVMKEWKSGQSVGGYNGFYRAYVYIPSYWAISTLDTKEISKVIKVYGDRFIYKSPYGMDGTNMQRYNVFGWSYCWGLEDERLIGKQDVGEDIYDVIKDIIDYELMTEPDVIISQTINQVTRDLHNLQAMLKDAQDNDFDVDRENIQMFISEVNNACNNITEECERKW